MSDLIDREAVREFIKSYRHSTDVAFHMEDHLDEIPAASPWHRVEDELPEMSEIASGYVCSETLVLYDDETGYMDIGYVGRKPNGNEVDWFWGLPLKAPTHWMPIEPPKEDA